MDLYLRPVLVILDKPANPVDRHVLSLRREEDAPNAPVIGPLSGPNEVTCQLIHEPPSSLGYYYHVRRCQIDGCDKGSLKGGKCCKHGGGDHCMVEGCDTIIRKGGKCVKHGGGLRCQIEGCDKTARSGGKCTRHGGGLRCQIDGCDKYTVL